MLQVHTANKLLADGVDLEYLATACVGMTGAQLANLANTAALRTVLEGRDEISQVIKQSEDKISYQENIVPGKS